MSQNQAARIDLRLSQLETEIRSLTGQIEEQSFRIDRTVHLLRQFTEPGDTILNLGPSPLFHILSGRTGPGYLDVIMPGMNGIQVLAWGARSARTGAASDPPDLLPDLVAKHGRHPAFDRDHAALLAGDFTIAVTDDAAWMQEMQKRELCGENVRVTGGVLHPD